jgi:hypothetical protein
VELYDCFQRSNVIGLGRRCLSDLVDKRLRIFTRDLQRYCSLLNLIRGSN